MKPDLGAVAVGIVWLWLLASLIYQYRPAAAFLGTYDVLRLLPRWTFFAPSPAMRDVHLVARSKDHIGNLSDWFVVEFAAPRPRADFLWHPSKRARKILTDACQSLKAAQRAGVSMQAMQFSQSYLLILNQCRRNIPADARNYQFSVVETAGRESDRDLFVSLLSNWHPI